MSLLRFIDVEGIEKIGRTAVTKPELSYGLSGRLYASESGWILLSVPNALVRGAFSALHEPGIELPVDSGFEGKLNAHISVMRPSELETISGGVDGIKERGKAFSYTLGPIRSVDPHGWSGVSKCWFITVKSRELKQLRKSYGLSALPNDNKFEFHITIAIRRTGALGGTKSAEQPFYQRALNTQLSSPHWDPDTGILSNITQNVQQAMDRGQRLVSEQAATNSLASDLDPQLKIQQMARTAAGVDSVVKNPIDTLLFRRSP